MAFLSIKNLFFSYKKTPVIADFSLEVREGTFTTLLGPSGCGKTTLLRLLGGFLEPASGKISMNGVTMNGILPNKRRVGVVFQDYALFPHLSVEQNLFYGLNIERNGRKYKESNKKIVLEMAEILGISELLGRFPSELSGGQQQRVALGRVLVLKPNILLMDEPLSSLDANLRKKVRAELKEIQKRLKITTIYVTHDREEALSLSDEIAVINEGRILQHGTPRKLYFNPADRFTASFMGETNFLDGRMVRPEWIEIFPADFFKEGQKGVVTDVEFLGSFTRYKVQVDGKTVLVDKNTVLQGAIKIGDEVRINILNECRLS